MMMPMPMPTPPMMCSLLLNTSSIAAGQLWWYRGEREKKHFRNWRPPRWRTTTTTQQQRGQAVCVRPVTVVMRASRPSFLGQMSLAASITVPVGPQQFSCEQEVTILVLLGTKKSTYDPRTHADTVTSNHSASQKAHSWGRTTTWKHSKQFKA